MKFGPLQLNYFNAAEGAYSPVTETEATHDRAVTLTGPEQELVEKHFKSEGIFRGNATTGGEMARKKFILFLNGNEERLKLCYPKPDKNELRLYFSKKQNFFPKTGDIWFVFRRGKNLIVGSLPENVWRSLGRADEQDEIYVSLAADEPLPPADPKRVVTVQHERNPAFARERFKLAGYRCEFDPGHELFIARTTGRGFVEPHHLVMVSLQDRFPKQRLDIIENIFALCPWCHRAVHHAELPLVTKIVTTLLERRSHICGKLSISTNDVLRLYNCEQIVK